MLEAPITILCNQGEIAEHIGGEVSKPREYIATYPDPGARELVRHHWSSTIDVEIGPAAGKDLDTLESLREVGWLPAQC